MRTVASADLDDSLDLEAIQAVLEDHPVRLAILFGSHATGATHSTSDVDIAVELDSCRSPDPDYNETFLGLSADLSDALGTDDVDLVDIRTLSPPVAQSVFDRGILLVGEREHAADLRREVTRTEDETRSPRERLDAALERIEAHLEGDDAATPVSGESTNDR